ncbi:MAG TPA: OmpH family outer membrane protein [Phenylobacterium sp.]|jgi:outer membrane protein|uniref:OmpH family outer membrane protein n=1 Tax=Phenylobacterium sp. TaxID=1871053 RepID=UPI002D6143D8|nr:OmpH family outer membrane protein [Phenylobacterium sp.]HZZ67257.1 OmpH family outer membrane protein [Phenylobacterium sp.]
MTSKPIAAGLCAAVFATCFTVSAEAAPAPAAAAPPASAAVTHGPPLQGVCIFSFDNAIGLSKVGQYVEGRMKQIVAQTQAELGGEKTAIDNDAKALDGQRATLDQTTFEQRGSQLQIRASALQRKAQLRDREVQATEQKAVQRVSQEMEPFIRAAYQAKACSILLQRNAVIIGNPAMDLTQTVVTGIDGKFTQFAFDREHLDQPGVATSTGGAPPIVQTPGPAPRATPPKPKR